MLDRWSALLPLGLVASNASFQVLTSRLVRTESPATMQFYTGWVGTVAASLVPTTGKSVASLIALHRSPVHRPPNAV